LPFLYHSELFYGASLCSVTYCVNRGLLDGPPGDRRWWTMETFLDLKYFLIVLTRNGWNVFATKSHSREFEALELFKIGRCERKALLQGCHKNSHVETIRICRNEYIRSFLFRRMSNIQSRNNCVIMHN